MSAKDKYSVYLYLCAKHGGVLAGQVFMSHVLKRLRAIL